MIQGKAFNNINFPRAIGFNRFSDLRRNWTSPKDEEGSGKISMTLAKVNIAHVEQMVNDDAQVTYEVIE